MKRPAELVRQNVVYSVLDYVSQPALMIVAAPILLKTLGAPQYGAWMLVNSIVATASGLGGGFGDSATKFVSMYRGRRDQDGVARSLLGTLVINCCLGVLLAAILELIVPFLTGPVFHVESALLHPIIIATRISAVVLLIRFAQVVFLSAIRAYERYRPAAITTVSARFLVIGSAVVLGMRGYGLIEILWATLLVESLVLIALALLARWILEIRSVPPFDLAIATKELSSFGVFTWLKSAMGVLFAYADRLMVAALLGTAPLAFFVLCNQLTQPIPALLTSGFNFLFPHLSAQSASGEWTQCRQNYRKAVLVSLIIVMTISLPMTLLARVILAMWLGPQAASTYAGLLRMMTVANGLLALAIVPHYTALALGRARALAAINLVAGLVSLTAGFLLLRHFGLMGGASIRVLAGLVSLAAFAIVRTAFQDATDSLQLSDQELSGVPSLDAVNSPRTKSLLGAFR
jgi:O-antigen/teichoic acid export membrane protein